MQARLFWIQLVLLVVSTMSYPVLSVIWYTQKRPHEPPWWEQLLHRVPASDHNEYLVRAKLDATDIEFFVWAVVIAVAPRVWHRWRRRRRRIRALWAERYAIVALLALPYIHANQGFGHNFLPHIGLGDSKGVVETLAYLLLLLAACLSVGVVPWSSHR